MASGLVVTLTFSDDVAEDRFKSWVKKGNERSELLGVGNLGLKVKFKRIGLRKYLFFYSHIFILNLSWFLRLALWVQFWRLRKRVKIQSVSKPLLAEFIIDGVGADGE